MRFAAAVSLRAGSASHRLSTPVGIATHLGGITQHGDRYLRCLFTHGARAVLVRAVRSTQPPHARSHGCITGRVTVRDRRGHNKATVAVANKLGRLVWAVGTTDVPHTPHRKRCDGDRTSSLALLSE